MPDPPWLPAMLLNIGDWNSYLADLYEVYHATVQHKRTLHGLPIFCNTRMEPFAGADFEQTFLHLITREDKASNARLYDPRRCEKLPWCGPLLDNADDPAVKTWRYKEARGDVQTYVWLEEQDYVLILRPREINYYGNRCDVYYIVTAYHVDGPSQRRSFQQKYERRET